MQDPREFLEQVTVKLERADKHILDLTEAFRSFHDSGPYTFTHKDDENTGNRTFYIQFRSAAFPAEWSAIIGDAIQNLRSALDHLATRLVDIGTLPRVKNAYYPIYESVAEYETDKLRKIKGARPEAIKAIDATEPYARGNGWILWDLHTLNNRDKHRLLIPAWGSLISHTHPKSERKEIERKFRATFPRGLTPGWLKAACGPAFLKDGDPLLTMPVAECEDHMRFKISIAFREPEMVKGKAATPTLQNMSTAVRKIISDFNLQGLL